MPETLKLKVTFNRDNQGNKRCFILFNAGEESLAILTEIIHIV